MTEFNIAEKQTGVNKVSKVSIVIPIYNREKLVDRTLNSILRQTYRPLEVILVDNGSTDSSYSICIDFKKKYETDVFHVLVVNEPKKGANAARNKGLCLATGDYISFYDSDDEMLPERISYVMNIFRQHEFDLVAFPICFHNENNKFFVKFMRRESTVVNQILTSTLSTQNFIAQTNFIRGIGGWNENLFRWQDWEFGIRIMLKSPRVFWIREKILDIIHIHPSSITGTNFSSSYDYLLETLHTVNRVIKQSQIMDQSQAMEALYFRQIQLRDRKSVV